MANGNSKGMTTGEKVALAAGTAFAAALGAGIAAFASRGKKTNTAGPRLKTKGCGGCGR